MASFCKTSCADNEQGCAYLQSEGTAVDGAGAVLPYAARISASLACLQEETPAEEAQQAQRAALRPTQHAADAARRREQLARTTSGPAHLQPHRTKQRMKRGEPAFSM